MLIALKKSFILLHSSIMRGALARLSSLSCPPARSFSTASSCRRLFQHRPCLAPCCSPQLRHRSFHTSPSSGGLKKPTVRLFFAQKDADPIAVDAEIGRSLLEVAHQYEIPVEGACEGSLACSTCHVILGNKLFKRLQEPCEDEEDMLDLAPDLTETSRLGCQVIVDKEMAGETITLPSHTLNFYVDGKVPVGH